jgi:hypothetical protein
LLASDEGRIGAVLRAVEEFFDRCDETVQHTARGILCKIYSQSHHGGAQRPFQLVKRLSSRASYIRVVKKFFSFLLSVYLMDEELCHSALKFRLTAPQRSAIGRLWNDSCWTSQKLAHLDSLPMPTLEDEVEEEMLDEDLNDDWNESEEEAEEDDGKVSYNATNNTFQIIEALPAQQLARFQETSAVGQLTELVLELSAFFAMEEYADGRPASTLLVYFSGILGMSSDGASFKKIRTYTLNLAALIYYERLIFLEWALPYRDYPYLGRSSRPAADHMAVLQPIRERYACFGCLTPLLEFVSLLAYGQKVAHTDGPTVQFHWSDDGQTISYGDNSLSIQQFRNLSHSLMDQCTQLCRKLMYGWEPLVQLDKVRDDMSNTQRGYSFIHHPSNHLSEVYLQLFKRACTAPEDALMRNDHWVSGAVRRFVNGSNESVRAELSADNSSVKVQRVLHHHGFSFHSLSQTTHTI